MVFNITFHNISVITWQLVLLMNETGENKGNNKITELRTILQRESPNS